MTDNDNVEDKNHDDGGISHPKGDIVQVWKSNASQYRNKEIWNGLRPQTEIQSNSFQLKTLISSIPKIRDRNSVTQNQETSNQAKKIQKVIEVC